MIEHAYKVYFMLQIKVTEERGHVTLARATKDDALKMESEANIRAYQFTMSLLVKEFGLRFNQ